MNPYVLASFEDELEKIAQSQQFQKEAATMRQLQAAAKRIPVRKRPLSEVADGAQAQFPAKSAIRSLKNQGFDDEFLDMARQYLKTQKDTSVRRPTILEPVGGHSRAEIANNPSLPRSPQDHRARNIFGRLHESFETKTAPHEMGAFFSHQSPRVLMDEGNMALKATGEGSDALRRFIRNMRDNTKETAGMEKLVRSFYGQRGVDYVRQHGYSRAMKNDLMRRYMAMANRSSTKVAAAKYSRLSSRMLTGAAVGALGGGGAGAALTDEREDRLKNALLGAALGAGSGGGLGYAYHKIRPVVGRMRSVSQALDNVAPMHVTRNGKVLPRAEYSGVFSNQPKQTSRSHKRVFSSDKVVVDRVGDRFVAQVTPITRDAAGRQAPVLVWRTDTKSSPKKFAREAFEYARKHHVNTPGGRRDFGKMASVSLSPDEMDKDAFVRPLIQSLGRGAAAKPGGFSSRMLDRISNTQLGREAMRQSLPAPVRGQPFQLSQQERAIQQAYLGGLRRRKPLKSSQYSTTQTDLVPVPKAALKRGPSPAQIYRTLQEGADQAYVAASRPGAQRVMLGTAANPTDAVEAVITSSAAEAARAVKQMRQLRRRMAQQGQTPPASTPSAPRY
jgi:hypothetical protein